MTKRVRTLALALLSAASWATAASWAGTVQAQPASTFQPQDVFSLSRASDPQFRPDGGLIAYVRTANDIMTDMGRKSIWLVDPRTGAQTPLGGADGEAFSPRWSPDGSRIAYVFKPKAGKPEIYVRWVASGQTARLADLQRPPAEISWSPDGRSVAFIMSEPSPKETMGAPLAKPDGAEWSDPLKVISRVQYRADGEGYLQPGYTHVFVVSADGGAPRQLTTGKFNDEGPLSWSPDSAAIVFTGRRGQGWEHEGFRSAVYRVAVQTGALTKLTTQEGPDGQARVSPDGRHIAYSGYDDHYKGYTNQHIYLMDADGGNIRTLAPKLDRSLAHPRWSADGRYIYADYADHGVTKVARLTLDGAMEDVAVGLGGDGLDLPYSGGDFDVAKDGTVAFTQGAAEHPADLAVVSRGQVRRLTRLNDDLFAGKTLGKLEPLAAVSSADKAPVDAWIVKPPGFDLSKKYPMILEIHGGPFASYGPTFATDDQLYAAAGYVVVYANPRGSTSYGDAFANGIDRSYPGLDYDDLMSAVDAAVAEGFIDPNRLFVTGGSGGGVLTAWIVGKTHRFRAAAAQKPVINWSSEVLTADLYTWMAKYWFNGLPWEDPKTYWARSPLSLVGNVTTPTLVVVGDKDMRTPDSESEQFFDALQIRGVPTTLIQVPGAFHDMAARPSHAAAKANAILAWFARYDVGAPAS
jgi:dipeptidyl aminopeptidase/acylaminoacyl peptidase